MTQKLRKQSRPAIEELLDVMARLRGPGGCPWDRQQTHHSLRLYAVEEVYELLEAIESEDDAALLEELGDVLLQVVFHAQVARERGAFDFDTVARRLTEKLVHRHPHVFGQTVVKDAQEVLTRWDELKKQEKRAKTQIETSVFAGIPRHLPALMRATELIKKAQKAGLQSKVALQNRPLNSPATSWTRRKLARELWHLVEIAHAHGWSAEALLRDEALRRERLWRQAETRRARATRPAMTGMHSNQLSRTAQSVGDNTPLQ
ncbi:MAG: MazG family protein [Verrucomicrobiota bacterium]|nr:MazG family protein [Limisphaera sp.]MDW8381982.1 MazG family protein [Verrucomicrobiota bacterium]